MSIKAMSWAWDRNDLSPGQKLVLLAIADHADDQGYCYPGYEKLAAKCCMNRSTVVQHVQTLEAIELLNKMHRADSAGHRASNAYQLNFGNTKVEISNVGKTNVGFSEPRVGISNPEPSEEPSEINKPNTRARACEDDPNFDRFWSAYPNKKSKGRAKKAWAKIKPSEQLVETMLESIERAKTSFDWQKSGGQYIPHPATWLNDEGWESEYEPAAKQPSRERGNSHETNRRGYQSAVSRQEEAARQYREKRRAKGVYDEPEGVVIEGRFCRVKG